MGQKSRDGRERRSQSAMCKRKDGGAAASCWPPALLPCSEASLAGGGGDGGNRGGGNGGDDGGIGEKCRTKEKLNLCKRAQLVERRSQIKNYCGIFLLCAAAAAAR